MTGTLPHIRAAPLRSTPITIITHPARATPLSLLLFFLLVPGECPELLLYAAVPDSFVDLSQTYLCGIVDDLQVAADACTDDQQCRAFTATQAGVSCSGSINVCFMSDPEAILTEPTSIAVCLYTYTG